MSILHRFYAVFPLILLMLALTGCGGGAWDAQRGGQTAPDLVGTAPPAQSAQAANAARAVKVAILLPLTGSNAALGESMLQAAQLAIFDLGYENFELMPRDTGGSAAGAAAAASTAMADGAQLILGPLFAEEVRAVKSATAGRGINVIAFSTDWTIAGGNTFMMGFMPFEQVARIADYAASRGLKTAAVAANADTYGTAAANAFENRARQDGIIVSRALSSPSAYDSVFIPAGGADLPGVLMRIAGKSAQKLGTGLWDDPRIAAMPDMNGAWFAAPSPTIRAGFEQRYQSTYGTRPVRIASLAYDATALAAALANAGFNAGKGPAFDVASLKNPAGFSGVDGILRFNARGIAERGMAVLEIRGGTIAEMDPAPSSFQR